MIMKKLVALLLTILAVGAINLTAQDLPGNKENIGDPSEGMEHLALARQLMNYGYDFNDPVSLLLAAKLFLEWSPAVFSPISGKMKSGEEAAKAEGVNVDKLIADAKKMGGNDPAVTSMAKDLEAVGSKGVVGGPVAGTYTLAGQDYVVFELEYRGDELAEVGVLGDGNADLDLFVFDRRMNPFLQDESPNYICYLSWYPRRTEVYYVVVYNRGTASSSFIIGTN